MEERNGLMKQRRLLRQKCEKKDKEIERLNNELKLYKDNHEYLNNLLQQKENIIKEVREYIYKNSFDEERKEIVEQLWINEINDILEILDKVEE